MLIFRAGSRLRLPSISSLKSMLRSNHLWSILLASVFYLLLATSAQSQGIATGSISGTVTDPSGASLPGAHVTAVSTATNQEFAGETNDSGVIVFRTVPPGFTKSPSPRRASAPRFSTTSRCRYPRNPILAQSNSN
jgi:Carboxypeptidase regulatory-like domain